MFAELNHATYSNVVYKQSFYQQAFAWLVLLAAISASFSSSLEETRKEGLPIEKRINRRYRNQGASQRQIRACDIRKYFAIRAASTDCDELLIGAFNIQQFGKKKFRNAPVMSVILQVSRPI